MREKLDPTLNIHTPLVSEVNLFERGIAAFVKYFIHVQQTFSVRIK